MTFSILRFDAPMMSFGAPIVSEEGRIQPYPALSMMTGVLANALGFERSEADRHEHLQGAISYAVREDVPGEKIEDYQTADLGLPHMQAKGKKESVAWTTWGHLDQRGSGNTDTTNIRNREYWADAQYTVALHVDGRPADEIEDALLRPERPLFIGRKPCLPAKRLFQGTVDAPSPKEALHLPSTIPTDENDTRIVPTRLWHESDDGMPVTDARDWANQIHVGERHIREESL
ncbi:type I-E CRISPR-associated protein Cas5/CasD [Salinibacter altiplanensis]|uniref:type I-E CRISPR-associated protein Cas5/CasD n=1 Tax=Salinibacter altiplanensis TaxID=1803181 RepID=UPI000C9F5E15|nr:type I-E CRISPR-associated protein Cas5/CasD [Salinibacter altiplanensis]